MGMTQGEWLGAAVVTTIEERDRYRKALEEIRAHIATACPCLEPIEPHCGAAIDDIAREALQWG